MRYKVIATTPEKETAQKIYDILFKSKIYNSSEIMSLKPIQEVCDECASK